MKKIVSFIVCLLCVTSAFTQEKNRSVGIGYMNSNFYFLNKNLNGVYLCYDHSVPIANNISFVPGVYYSSSAAKGINGRFSTRESLFIEQYLGIPCKISYSENMPHDMQFHVFAGPTLSLGLSSLVIKKNDFDEYQTRELYVELPPKYRRLDVLIGCGVAFDFSNTCRLTLGYNYGLRKRIADWSSSYFNRFFPYVGVSYLF